MDFLVKMKDTKDNSEYKDKQLSIQEFNALTSRGTLDLNKQVQQDLSANRWANTRISQQNADTSAYNAQTSAANAETNRMNYELAKQKQEGTSAGKQQYLDESMLMQVLDSKTSQQDKLDVVQNPTFKAETINKYGLKYYNELVKAVQGGQSLTDIMSAVGESATNAND